MKGLLERKTFLVKSFPAIQLDGWNGQKTFYQIQQGWKNMNSV